VALTLNNKQGIVAELNALMADSLTVAVAHYNELDVADMTELRKLGRERNVHIQVVRNTLAKRAISGTDFACLEPVLVGPTVMLSSKEAPGAAARLVKDFAKDHEKLVIQGIALNGELLGPENLDSVASLPTYDEAISMLMSVMKAPITKFVRTVREPVAKMVRTVSAVADDKKVA
jgi:large subunit ribosomal protein L10